MDGPPSAKERKSWFFVMAGVVLLVGLPYLAISVYAASEITKSAHRPLDRPATDVSPNYEAVSFFSRVDHLRLKGWLFHVSPRTGSSTSWLPPVNQRSAILLHGHDSNRVNLDWGELGIAKDLVAHGLDVLVFDLRAAGESEGNRETFATLEPRDLLGAYDFMTFRGYRRQSMLVMGASMGADTLLEAAAELKGVGALVSDSAYADVQEVIVPRLHARLPGFFDLGIITAAHLLYGLDMNLRPIDVVHALPDRAFLFIVCDADDYIPSVNSRELSNASINAESELVTFQCSKHLATYKTNRSQYLVTLFAFVDRQLAEHGG
jgi:uncharacterized protein